MRTARTLGGALLAGGVALSTLLAPGVAVADDDYDKHEPEVVEYDIEAYADLKKVHKYRSGDYAAKYELKGYGKSYRYKGYAHVECDYKPRKHAYKCEVETVLYKKYGKHSYKKEGVVYSKFSYDKHDYTYEGKVKGGKYAYEGAKGEFDAYKLKHGKYELKVHYTFKVEKDEDKDDKKKV